VSHLNINNGSKKRYQKEVKLKIIDGELRIVEFEKPKNVLKELDNLYKELVVDKIDYVKVLFNTEKPIFEINYDGLNLKYNKVGGILDPNYFLNKTQFYLGDKRLFSLNKLRNDLSIYLNSIGNSNIQHGYQEKILGNLDFIYDRNNQAISISTQYDTSTGGNPVFIYGYFDIKNEDFNYFKFGNGAFGNCKNIYYSPNKDFIGYSYKDWGERPILEIYSKSNAVIKVIPKLLSDEMKNFYNNLEIVPLIKNVKWLENVLYFEMIEGEFIPYKGIKPEENGESHSFKFNIKENKLIEIK
jgi:hypothetical protein